MPSTTTLLVGGAVVAGAAVLYVRHKQAQTAATAAPSACESAAKLAAAGASTYATASGVPTAPPGSPPGMTPPAGADPGQSAAALVGLGCHVWNNLGTINVAAGKVGQGVAKYTPLDEAAGWVARNVFGWGRGRSDTKCSDAAYQKNVELNGAVVDRVPPEFPMNNAVPIKSYSICRGTLRDANGKIVKGTNGNWSADLPLRYANGCTPFPGSPGWAKCAPGTANFSPTNKWWSPWIGSGVLGKDPLTVEHTGNAAKKKFPIDVPPGARAFWRAGKPFVCTSITRDHRNGLGGALTCDYGVGTDGDLPVTPPPVRRGSTGVTVSYK